MSKQKDIEATEVEGINHGDVWLLGNHRLMCGSATSLVDVQKLMNGKRAEMLWTDPPYNVNYIPENRELGGRKKQKLGGIMNDVTFDYNKWYKVLETGIVKGGMYITSVCKNMPHLYTWMNGYFKKETLMLLWIKNNHILSRADYHKSYEIILYNRTGEGVWNGGRDQKTEWYVRQRPVNTYVHPTQKPLRLIVKAILNNSNEGDIVLDMFGGSGATMIACEQNNRNCYMLELDPKYVDVIIQRWEKFTKQKAVKIAGGTNEQKGIKDSSTS